jgi:hypothetical protein
MRTTTTSFTTMDGMLDSLRSADLMGRLCAGRPAVRLGSDCGVVPQCARCRAEGVGWQGRRHKPMKESSMLYIAVVPQPVSTEPVSPQANTVARFYEAIQSGDYASLNDVLTPDAVTRWPQSGERITGALACIRV